MFTIIDLIQNLPAYVVHAEEDSLQNEIQSVVAADLMSDVLVSVDVPCVLVTSLATEQVIRTCDISGIQTVLLVNDKLPSHAMKSLAKEVGITLLASPQPMYEACVNIHLLKSFSE